MTRLQILLQITMQIYRETPIRKESQRNTERGRKKMTYHIINYSQTENTLSTWRRYFTFPDNKKTTTRDTEVLIHV